MDLHSETPFPTPAAGGEAVSLWHNGAEYCPVTAFLNLGAREERALWLISTTGKPIGGPGSFHEIHFGDDGAAWLITPLSMPVPGLEDWTTVIRVDGWRGASGGEDDLRSRDSVRTCLQDC